MMLQPKEKFSYLKITNLINANLFTVTEEWRRWDTQPYQHLRP